MSIEINISDIGTEEVEVTEILVKVGDKIEEEQSLITVEGNKVSMEIPSPKSGIVKEIKVSIGDKVNTGQLIMIFDPVEDITFTSDTLKKEKKEENTISLPPTMPSITRNVCISNLQSSEAKVKEILVQVGDQVEKEQLLIITEGDKGIIKIKSPFSGIVKEIKVKINDKIFTGSLIMIFEVSDLKMLSSIETNLAPSIIDSSGLLKKYRNSIVIPKEKKEKQNTFIKDDAYIHASPIIRRLARELSINLSQVKGTGRKNRILRKDIYAYVKEAIENFESFSDITTNISTLPLCSKFDFDKLGEVEEVKLGRIQKISGAKLSRNWMMIPHVTLFEKTDITELEAFRKQQNIELEKHGVDIKISLVIFVIKAISSALEKMPRFNSSLSENGQFLILKKYINIGVAVDTPKGLVVPVIKNVNKKGILEISQELKSITNKARFSNLNAEEMQGGCFTLSSIGSLGTTYFTPIINAPEVAILGVSKSSLNPVWNGKEFVPRLILPLSLSFDHRVIDGADGARFITIINNNLNDIRRLIM